MSAIVPGAAARFRLRSGRGTLAVLALGAFATGTDSFVIAGVLPAVAADLGGSVGAVGLTVSVFALAYAVGGPLLVTATARFPARRVMSAAMGVFVLANVAAALAPTVVALGAARVVAALGAGVFVPGAIAAAAALGGEARRARSVAVVVGGASLALVAGAPLGTLVAQATSWRGSIGLVAALGTVAVAGVALLAAEPPSPPAPALAERLAVVRRPAVAAVLGTTLLANAAAFAVYPYLGVLFPGSGPAGVALVVLAFGLGAVAGTWLGGRVADAVGARTTVLVVVALFALDHAVLGLVAGSLALGVVYAAVWGVTGWATVPAQQSRLIGLCGPAAPLALSLNSSAIHLGTGLGALAGAAVLSGPGPGAIWIVATAASLLALALVPLGGRAWRTAPTRTRGTVGQRHRPTVPFVRTRREDTS